MGATGETGAQGAESGDIIEAKRWVPSIINRDRYFEEAKNIAATYTRVNGYVGIDVKFDWRLTGTSNTKTSTFTISLPFAFITSRYNSNGMNIGGSQVALWFVDQNQKMSGFVMAANPIPGVFGFSTGVEIIIRQDGGANWNTGSDPAQSVTIHLSGLYEALFPIV